MRKIFIVLTIICTIIIGGCEKNEVNINDNNHIDPSSKLYSQNFPTISDIEDNYIPPLNTMIKFKTNYENIDDIMVNLEPILIEAHKNFDAHHYYRDENDDLIRNVAIINDNYASNESLTITDELSSFILKNIELSKLTRGYFNPTMGALSALYDGKFSPFPVTNVDPDSNEIKKALGCIVKPDDMDDVIEIKDNTIIFNQYNDCEEVVLDFGASAKGEATNILANKLNKLDYDYVLDVGSSNIIANSLDGTLVGIRSPYNKVSSIYSINLLNGWGLSTSGDDNNYYMLEDDPTIIRSHILDPNTGYSQNYYRSVTVLSSDSMIADVLSTALFNISNIDEIIEIVDDVKDYYGIEIEFGLLREVDSEKQLCDLYISQGFEKFIAEDYISTNINSIIVIGE